MVVTIRDVAERARVSNGTVSRAFNGYPDILPETRARILDIANTLGYSPNITARSLSGKHPSNIGFIVSGLLQSDAKDNQIHQLLQGVYEYGLDNGLEIALYTTDSRVQKQKSYMQFCRERRLGGAILSGIATDDAYMAELIDTGIPTVGLDIALNGANTAWVSVDNRVAAREIAELLLQQGHRDLLVMDGKQNAEVSMVRMRGVQDALALHGLSLPPERHLFGDFSEGTAFEQARTFFAQHHAVTAVLCLSDLMAFGVIRAATECGLAVPEDISITGFDDLLLSRMISPSLTTVRQDMRLMGHEATRLLHSLMQHKAVDHHTVLPHSILQRDSVRVCT